MSSVFVLAFEAATVSEGSSFGQTAFGAGALGLFGAVLTYIQFRKQNKSETSRDGRDDRREDFTAVIAGWKSLADARQAIIEGQELTLAEQRVALAEAQGDLLRIRTLLAQCHQDHHGDQGGGS